MANNKPSIEDTRYYADFLKIFKLKKNKESIELFKKFVRAQATRKRGAAPVEAPPVSDRTGDFFTTKNNVVTEGKAKDTIYGETANAFLEVPVGADKKLMRANFWATSFTYGYGSSGQTAQSRFFSAYYANSFKEDPIFVKGRLPSDDALASFTDFVRGAQLQMGLGRGLMRLCIPGGQIDMGGFIGSINVGYEGGFPTAPEISFDFIVVNRDGSTVLNTGYSQTLVAYFMHPDDSYWSAQSRKFDEDLRRDLESDLINRITKTNKRARSFIERTRDVQWDDFGGW